jgi:outer membrane receptor protein involved in Fe transport
VIPTDREAAPRPSNPIPRTPASRAQRRALARVLLALVIGAASAAAVAVAADGELDEVVVTATLRPAPALAVPTSVTVLDARTIADAGQQHFEDLLATVPNLNWAGDTSRPRYFQLRGIGELEQYQGAPNPSIGFLIDDIDFSGLGSAATMFDVDHVEVLRGPQGTRYGANALGGLIYVASAAPEQEFGGRAELLGGDYNTRSIGGVITGPVDALDSAFRLAVQRFTSDGFYRNVYLNRDDTNSRDELTLRGRWRYQPSTDLRVDVSVLDVQMNNGYDAFSPDNNHTTYSNQPGVDAQHSTGVSVHVTDTAFAPLTITAIGTYAESLVKYSYDGDWGNPAYWYPYVDNFTEVQLRNRETESAELRISTSPEHGVAWLVGAYVSQLRETLNDTSQGESDDPINGYYAQDTVVDSGYRARNLALFGVLDGDLGERLRWSLGLRGERRTSTYQDLTQDFIAGASTANNFAPAENLWGGHASLNYQPAPTESIYLQLARGYKAGGFNLSQGLEPSQILFKPEADWNLETGYKAELLGRRLTVDADVFALYREDAQIKSSLQTQPNNPNTFIFYTGNAVSGFNYGLESSLAWQATRQLSIGGALGLLHTYFHDFATIGTDSQASVSRQLANAPNWQAAANATWRAADGLFGRLDVTGMGAYYFDLPPNDTRSNAYGLANVKVGRETPRWSAYLWVRNVLNKDYPVRGFYFGLVPPYYANQLWLQLGDPRTYGANVVVRFGGGS